LVWFWSDFLVLHPSLFAAGKQAWDLNSGKSVQRLEQAHDQQPIMQLLAFEVCASVGASACLLA
jgi:hypothetical protein